VDKIKKIAITASGVLVGASVLALTASADTGFGTTTAVTATNGLILDVSLIIAGVVTGILGLLAALMGLGWGVKSFRKYITGKKF